MVDSGAVGSDTGRTKFSKWLEVPLRRFAKCAIRHLSHPLVLVHKHTVLDCFKKGSELTGVGGHLHRICYTFCARMVIGGVPLRRVQIFSRPSRLLHLREVLRATPDGDDATPSKLKVQVGRCTLRNDMNLRRRLCEQFKLSLVTRREAIRPGSAKAA